MEKEVNKLVDIYAKFIGSDLEVHKIHGAPGTPLSKSQIEDKKKGQVQVIHGKVNVAHHKGGT